MPDFTDILGLFCSSRKNEILEYYNRFYSYLKDLFADKSIDLKFKTSYESDKSIKQTLDNLLKTIKISLSTIGVKRDRFSAKLEIIHEFDDYNSYLLHYKPDIDVILFEILLEFITEVDTSKIENLDLFDLLPRNFIYNLETFAAENVVTMDIKTQIREIIPKITDYIDPSKVSMKVEFEPVGTPVVKKKIEAAEIKPSIPIDDIEALKASIKAAAVSGPEVKKAEVTAVSKPAMTKPEPAPAKVESRPESVIKEPPREVPSKIEIMVPEIPTIELDELIESKNLFFDVFGRFNTIGLDKISNLNINTINLITSRNNNPDFLNLETLFYYISILKMLNVDLPFSQVEIAQIALNYINKEKKMFSASQDDQPDPISIFYGLSIFSELDLLNNTDIIDLLDIEMFLEAELNDFIPEKLHLTFFTLLALKILEKNGAIISDKSHLINDLMGLNLKNMEKYDPILDAFEQIACILLIDRDTNLTHFRSIFMEEIRRLITNSGSVKDTITDTARVLLIIELLELKRQYFLESQRFLRYLADATEFFDSLNDENFDWRNDKWAFTVELRMLFWALLALSRFKYLS